MMAPEGSIDATYQSARSDPFSFQPHLASVLAIRPLCGYNPGMIITLPDHIPALQRMTEPEVRRELAVALCSRPSASPSPFARVRGNRKP